MNVDDKLLEDLGIDKSVIPSKVLIHSFKANHNVAACINLLYPDGLVMAGFDLTKGFILSTPCNSGIYSSNGYAKNRLLSEGYTEMTWDKFIRQITYFGEPDVEELTEEISESEVAF